LDASATNHTGKTPLDLIMDERVAWRFYEDDQAALLKLLRTGGGNVDETDANGDTALHHAAGDLMADRVASLLAAGASINADQTRRFNCS
jgi:ankyrin repeat protein